ncbi:MAG: LLM class F420-dependent oxidoreductase [Anaerolineaceae bacterium]|nr:LLM class F420-dependent oxidoreductase [Anaerolineaceae bacterium]
MRIGLQIPSFTWPGGPAALAPTLTKIVTTAEDAGFFSVWVMDHFFQIEMIGPAEHEMMEGYSTLSYIAGLTKRVKLGTLVTGAIYRYPGLLVKTVNTLDVLSGGRAYLGIGAGWFEREAKGLGVPFPPVAVRFERLEEALQIAHQMWTDNNGAYNGKHYQLAETLSVPQPLTQPHPPILIGGMGEQKTLRLVAQYADACNLFVRAGADIVRQKLDILKGHCDTVGRDYETIERTGLATIHLAPERDSTASVIALCQEMAGLGIQHLIFNMPNVEDISPLEIFGREIIPAVAAL